MRTLLLATLLLISLPAYGDRKIDWSIGKSVDLNQLHIADIRGNEPDRDRSAGERRVPASADVKERRSVNGVGFYQSFGSGVCATRSAIRNCY